MATQGKWLGIGYVVSAHIERTDIIFIGMLYALLVGSGTAIMSDLSLRLCYVIWREMVLFSKREGMDISAKGTLYGGEKSRPSAISDRKSGQKGLKMGLQNF